MYKQDCCRLLQTRTQDFRVKHIRLILNYIIHLQNIATRLGSMTSGVENNDYTGESAPYPRFIADCVFPRRPFKASHTICFIFVFQREHNTKFIIVDLDHRMYAVRV